MSRWTNTWRVGLLDQHRRRVADQIVSRVEVASMFGVGCRDLTFTDLPSCTITEVALIPPDGAFVPIGMSTTTIPTSAPPLTLVLPTRIEVS